jgi:hypothetical protein
VDDRCGVCLSATGAWTMLHRSRLKARLESFRNNIFVDEYAQICGWYSRASESEQAFVPVYWNNHSMEVHFLKLGLSFTLAIPFSEKECVWLPL